MKSNTSISHRIAALLLAALLLFGMALTASAATYQAGDNVRIYHDFALPFKLKERNAEGFPWMATGYLTNALVPPTGASWVYCIDYWHSASGGTYTTTDLMQTPAWTSLSFVARKGITHAMIYGCPNNGRNDIYSYAATQLIIWEYQLGQRSNASQTVTYFSSTLSQNATLRSIYNSILSSMAAHDVLPSFDGQSVTLQGYGRENGVTLTDTNGKLANDSWTIATGSGFHVEQNGNNLLIYADSSVAADSTTTVTLKRNLNVVTGTALGITVGAQKAILGVPPDPVSAALSVKMEAKADLEIIKTSTAGKVSGISFEIEQFVPGIGWCSIGTYETNSSGKINLTDYDVGTQLRVTEIVPAGYVCTSQNPQTITLVSGTNRLTFTNEPTVGLEIVKTCSDGKINNISFKVEQYEASGGIGWWEMGTYQTDANGKITIDDLDIGTKLRVTEIVPSGYVCNSTNPQTITLKAGTNKLTFENEPLPKLEIIKSCSDGKINGISFKVERKNGSSWAVLGTYTTDSAGKITIPNLTKGQQLRVTETVPEGYICTSENPQTITLTAGTNVLTFVNEPLSDLEIVKVCSDGNIKDLSFKIEQYEPEGDIGWWEKGIYTTDAEGKITLDGLRIGAQFRVTELVPEGYVCLSDNPQEIMLAAGTNTLTFENEPLASLEIIKTSTDGKVDGINFLVEKFIGRRWRTIGTYETDSDGRIEVPDLNVGSQIRVTERVPENYICLSENPQILTLVAGTNTVSFENKPVVRLELVKESDDGNVDGIEFTLSVKRNRLFVDIGTYVTQDGGKIIVEDLTRGAIYRLTENVPEGYIGETPVQEFTAQLGTNTVTFTNRLIRGSLRIVKVDKATQTPLEGAGYRLLNADGEELATGYTDENGELSFEDLPYGEYSYQEFEAPSGFVLDDTIYTFSITQDGVEIAKQHENEIVPGSILIKKVDENNRPLAGVTFLLEFSVNDGEIWTPVFDRNESDPVQAGGCTSENLHPGKLTTGQKGQVLFSGLCVDTQLGTVLYRLTEVSTVDGYNLLAEPVFEGSIQPGEKLDLSFTVVNTPTFKMPATGGVGFSLTALCMALSAIAAGLFVALKRKQRN